MFILTPDGHHPVVKTDINATNKRVCLHSESPGTRIDHSAFDNAAEQRVTNGTTSKNTGIC